MTVKVRYNLTDDGTGKRAITIYLSKGDPLVVEGTNENFDKILELLVDSKRHPTEKELQRLANPIKLIGQRLLSERVKVIDGLIYFDNDPIDNSITKQIIRVLEEEKEDWAPIVNFLEKISTNPSKHSRDQLYDWLGANDFTILHDGDILGYKGVYKKDGGVYESSHSGEAIINGDKHKEGRVKQRVGDVIEIARSKVDDNPHAACSTGLHVASWKFAKNFTNSAVLLVRVNPRDVVSVPHGGTEKIRCSRYKVLAETDKEITDPFYSKVPGEWRELHDKAGHRI